MNWNFIVGALAVMFLVFITERGELQTYLQLLIYAPPSSGAGSGAHAQSSGVNGPTSYNPFAAIQSIWQGLGAPTTGAAQ